MTKIDCPQTLATEPTTMKTTAEIAAMAANANVTDDQLIDIVPLANIDGLVSLEVPSIATQPSPKFDSFTEFWCWLWGTTPAYRSFGSV